MAQIEVPEKYAAELQALAQQDDRSLQSVVDEALGIYISERHTEHQLSPADIEHIRLGIAAADGGELVPSEEIEASSTTGKEKPPQSEPLLPERPSEKRSCRHSPLS